MDPISNSYPIEDVCIHDFLLFLQLLALLFSDMLLLAQEDAYGNLNVVEHPFYIYDVLSLDFSCTHREYFTSYTCHCYIYMLLLNLSSDEFEKIVSKGT